MCHGARSERLEDGMHRSRTMRSKLGTAALTVGLTLALGASTSVAAQRGSTPTDGL